jgi:hypothetical protein
MTEAERRRRREDPDRWWASWLAGAMPIAGGVLTVVAVFAVVAAVLEGLWVIAVIVVAVAILALLWLYIREEWLG